mmetsp:Transcript_16242/g.41473  ORF Transcript_16242/g.41473 Transcript_16242/m.41473 type:complete len:110 (+) Transcript_16242:37-366(+)
MDQPLLQQLPADDEEAPQTTQIIGISPRRALFTLVAYTFVIVWILYTLELVQYAISSARKGLSVADPALVYLVCPVPLTFFRVRLQHVSGCVAGDRGTPPVRFGEISQC